MNNPLYLKCSKVIEKIENEKTSFKNALYHFTNSDDKYFKKVYCITIELNKQIDMVNKIFNFYDLVEIESSGVSSYLFKVLLYEEFLSKHKKLKIGGRVVKYLRSKTEEIKNLLSSNSTEIRPKQESLLHFRVLLKNRNLFDSNKLTLENIDVQNSDMHLININKENNKVNLFKLRDDSIIKIQSYSSCLPPLILKNYYKTNKKLKDQFCIIDSCSAPGNKTLQLADYFFVETNIKRGNIFAFEINQERFNLLKTNINQAGYEKIIKVNNEDFLLANPNDQKYSNVDMILCDPSCSGSGTCNSNLSCIDICSLKVENSESNRLEKLSFLQEKILIHSMKFPSVTTVVYSTCSVYKEENEDVVNNVLKKNNEFELVNIFDLIADKKFHKGISDETDKLGYCLRTCKKCFNQEGFFVALFKRK